jgi:hypothetical protein
VDVSIGMGNGLFLISKSIFERLSSTDLTMFESSVKRFVIIDKLGGRIQFIAEVGVVDWGGVALLPALAWLVGESA